MDISPVKTFGQKNFAKKIPTNRIIHLLEIQFKDQGLGLSDLKVMHDFMKAQDPIQNKYAFHEGRLRRAQNFMGHRRETRCKPLCRKLGKVVDKRNGTELRNGIRTFNLGDEREDNILSLDKSTVPKQKPWMIAHTRGFRTGQNLLKKEIENPSGLGAELELEEGTTTSISSSDKGIER